MNTSSSLFSSLSRRAFTLIELLVVITIIAVLAGLLLPVTQKVIENSRKVSTKNTELQIIAAVNSYQTEYGQYPVVQTDPTNPLDVTVGIAQTNNVVLFNVLRALNASDDTTKALNARQIVYFESKNAKNASTPRDGFVVANSATGNPNNPNGSSLKIGDLVDSWGNLYAVRIDSGYTNAVKNPYVDDSANANDLASDSTDPTNDAYKKTLRTSVVSWTYGNDGQKGNKGATVPTPYAPTPGDDIDSWQ